MNTVFPVEVRVFREAGDGSKSRLLQGFTRDVSAGGMCVELKSFGKETEKLFQREARLDLTINPTFSAHPIRAAARIAWLQRQEEPHPPRYLIGIAYTEIDERAKRRIFSYAQRLRWLPRFAALAALGLFALLAGQVWHNQSLVAENRRLVNEVVESATKKSGIASNLYQMQKRKMTLDSELGAARGRIGELETLLKDQGAEAARLKADHEKELSAMLERRERIGREIDFIQEGKERLQATYKTLEAADRLDPSVGIRQMYGWLQSHRNLRTGLVASYEGDASLEDWAFTYDQALACQTFLLFNDLEHAEAILSFYDTRAVRQEGAFLNAYDTVDGSPKENVVRAGPNIWIGIAALQYEHLTKDGRFLSLARRIGDWVLTQSDAEGGVRGGPDVQWFSTEHNLDAYAFFSLLYRETKHPSYREGRDRTLEWIRKYAYTAKERRMQRGKGDATIATDTFSWAVAAIGPAKLKEIGFDPEAIMAFAEEHCEVSVSFSQPNGKTAKARGFDFAKAENLGRGGVISTEWTAQVIVAYQVLAEHFDRVSEPEKADLYRQKAIFYQNELQKLLITSPSRTGQGRGCLPYASTDNVDTGHGWRTPKGRRTGSVAGTAYGLFAWTGYNPFEFDNDPRVPL